MASEKFNTLTGISVGIPPVNVVDSTGNVVSNFNNLTGNVSANRVFANSYFYANGEPFTGSSRNGVPGGGNATLQFNNGGNFAGTINLTYNTNSNTINVPNLLSTGVVELGPISNVRITGGSNNQVLTTDGLGNLRWQTALGTGNGSPGGSNTQIQFNNSGFFEGSSAFTFNNSTNTVQVTGNLIANTFQMGSGIYKFSNSEVYFASTTSTASGQVLYSVPVASISGVEFHIIATNQAANTRQSSKISSVTYREQVQFVEYAGLEIGGGVGTFDVHYNPGNLDIEPSLELRVTPFQSMQIDYKMLVTVL